MATKKYAKWVPFDYNGKLVRHFNISQQKLDNPEFRAKLRNGNQYNHYDVKPNFEFDAKLSYHGWKRSPTGCFTFLDETGIEYPILIRDMARILSMGRVASETPSMSEILNSTIDGRWTFDRQYSYWGLVLIK